MLGISRFVSIFVIVLGVSADDPIAGGRLKLVESPPRDELDSVVKAVLSPDGKFLYASSCKLASVLTFARDAQTGKLELKQTITDPDILAGVTGLGLSPDGNLAIAPRSNRGPPSYT
jgi:hypothetical protein